LLPFVSLFNYLINGSGGDMNKFLAVHSRITTRVFSRQIGLLSILGCCLLAPLAHAESIDTLDKLRKTHTLLIGVRDDSLPFSTLGQGNATGYSVELCNKVLEQTRKELKLPDLKAQYVQVTQTDRFKKLKDGVIDLECASTVNTRSRQVDASFSFAHFVGGERMLTRKNTNIQDISNLAGKTVAVVAGTTAEKLFTQLRDGQMKTMKLEIFTTNREAFKALETGKVAAFGQLDIILESQRLQSSDADQFVLSQTPLSVEPMGLMLRKDDAAFRTIVDKTLSTLYSSGEINAIYDRWFNSGKLQVPMSRMLRECLTRPSREPGVALGLGYSL